MAQRLLQLNVENRPRSELALLRFLRRFTTRLLDPRIILSMLPFLEEDQVLTTEVSKLQAVIKLQREVSFDCVESRDLRNCGRSAAKRLLSIRDTFMGMSLAAKWIFLQSLIALPIRAEAVATHLATHLRDRGAVLVEDVLGGVIYDDDALAKVASELLAKEALPAPVHATFSCPLAALGFGSSAFLWGRAKLAHASLSPRLTQLLGSAFSECGQQGCVVHVCSSALCAPQRPSHQPSRKSATTDAMLKVVSQIVGIGSEQLASVEARVRESFQRLICEAMRSSVGLTSSVEFPCGRRLRSCDFDFLEERLQCGIVLAESSPSSASITVWGNLYPRHQELLRMILGKKPLFDFSLQTYGFDTERLSGIIKFALYGRGVETALGEQPQPGSLPSVRVRCWATAWSLPVDIMQRDVYNCCDIAVMLSDVPRVLQTAVKHAPQQLHARYDYLEPLDHDERWDGIDVFDADLASKDDSALAFGPWKASQRGSKNTSRLPKVDASKRRVQARDAACHRAHRSICISKKKELMRQRDKKFINAVSEEMCSIQANATCAENLCGVYECEALECWSHWSAFHLDFQEFHTGTVTRIRFDEDGACMLISVLESRIASLANSSSMEAPLFERQCMVCRGVYDFDGGSILSCSWTEEWQRRTDYEVIDDMGSYYVQADPSEMFCAERIELDSLDWRKVREEEVVDDLDHILGIRVWGRNGSFELLNLMG